MHPCASHGHQGLGYCRMNAVLLSRSPGRAAARPEIASLPSNAFSRVTSLCLQSGMMQLRSQERVKSCLWSELKAIEVALRQVQRSRAPRLHSIWMRQAALTMDGLSRTRARHGLPPEDQHAFALQLQRFSRRMVVLSRTRGPRGSHAGTGGPRQRTLPSSSATAQAVPVGAIAITGHGDPSTGSNRVSRRH